MHRQQQEPSLYSSAAPKGACKPHCSHIDIQSRDDLLRGSNHIFAHLRKFGLCMHVGRGDKASKTEAMYFPSPRTAYEAADTSRFYVEGTGFIDFCEKFKYLGAILHYSLTSDADVDKRVASATAAFGALKNSSENIFNFKYLSEELKGELYKALAAVKLGSCGKIYSNAFEVSITGVLAQCAA